MKRIISGLVILVCGSSLWAASKGETLRSLYDVVAPVLAGSPAAADRQVGQIFYDTTAGAFKGVNSAGGIDRLSNVAAVSGSVVKASVSNASEDDLVFDNGTAPVIFRDETYDTSGMYNPANGVFTAAVNGQYTFSAAVRLTGTNYVAGDSVSIRLQINSLLTNGSNYVVAEEVSGDKNSIYLNITADLTLAAGDSVSLDLSVFRVNSAPLKPSGFGGWASFKQIP